MTTYQHPDAQYLKLLQDVLDNGVQKEDRTGTGTLSVFSRTMRFDISDGKIPLLTTKKVFTKGLIHELLWFLSGDTNIRYLKKHNVNIWDSWVKEGTEEYEWLSEEEIQERLSTHLKKDDPKFITWFEEDPTVLEGDYDHQNVFGRDDIGHIGTRFFYHDIDGLRKAYREYIGKEPLKLVAGELGQVYGKQWRAWEDLRVVGELEVKDFLKNGYSIVTGAIIQREGEKTIIDGLKKHFSLDDLIVKKVKDLDDCKLDTAVVNGLSVGVLLVPDEERSLDEFYEKNVGESPIRLIFEHGRPIVMSKTIDQIAEIIDQLKNNPDSRRIILNAWNVGRLNDMQLPPCHLMLQFYTEPMSEKELKKQLSENEIGFSPMEMIGVEPGTVSGYEFWKKSCEKFGLPTRHLSAQLYCRSQDLPLGTPFNIAQYGVFVHMVAQTVNMKTKDFVWIGGDCHIYSNQINGVKEQLSREPLWSVKPQVNLNSWVKNIDDFTFDDIEIVNYDSRPEIKFPKAAV